MTDEERLQDLWQELDKLTEVIKKMWEKVYDISQIVNKQDKQINWLNKAVTELQKREKAADAARRARAMVEEAKTGEEE